VSYFNVCLLTGILASMWSGPVHGAELREALMLQGSACWKDRDSIRQALLNHSEIHAVDAHSVPGYLLIDVAAGAMTAGELAETVNRLYAVKDNCRAEPMQSCISPGGHHPTEHEPSSTAHR
jgi:hypothetical protein